MSDDIEQAAQPGQPAPEASEPIATPEKREQRKLTPEQKIAIVTELATFATPTEVQAQMREEFGLELQLNHIVCYDGSKKRARGMLGEDLISLFDTIRAAFISDIVSHAVSHKAYRLGRYQQMLDRAVDQKNPKLALRILRQAAMDSGDRYTNRRELTGKDGEPVRALVASVQLYLPDNRRGAPPQSAVAPTETKPEAPT